MEISISTTRNHEGKIVYLNWLFRNISDRQQAEATIREQASLLDVTTDAIFVKDLSDRFLFWNQGAERYQAIVNLGLNARDAMPKGGKLTISAENLDVDKNYARMSPPVQIGSYVVVTISDTGVGISPEIIDRIFEPFFTTKEIDKGTGLGLATTMEIVRKHGGFIKVKSEVGKGTQFKVFLPAAETSTIEAEKQPNLPRGNDELILVVDDEVTICEIVKTSLESYGYRVQTATDSIEAIALYADYKHEVSAVLMDIVMPCSLNGVQMLQALRKINPQVKIIAISGLNLGEQSDRSKLSFKNSCQNLIVYQNC